MPRLSALASALAAPLLVLALAAPAGADEFTDVVEGALAAYRDGDIGIARDELDYALKLLNDMKAESLARYLPEAQPGWTREIGSAEGSGFAMAMFGGGTAASATYRQGDQSFELTIVANSPMVGGIAAMVSGMTSMGGGETMRIKRTQFGVNGEEMQGVIDNRVLVSATGSAPVEAKRAHIESMDFEALADF